MGRNSITLQVNGEVKDEPEVDATLQQFYSTKVERVLFVAADPGVQYEKVIRFIDRTNGVVDHLIISLLTPGAEREVCLGVRMPDRPFAPY